MSRALSPCGEPGCPTLTRQPYCPTHAPRGRARRSPTTRAQRDGTGDYERNRKVILAGRPLCVLRIRGGGAPATTADHIVPVAEGGTHALSNLQPACHPCNSAKGRRTGRRSPPARVP